MTTVEAVNPAYKILEGINLTISPEFKEVLDSVKYEEKFVLGGVRGGKSTYVAADIITDGRFWAGMLPRKGMDPTPFLVWIVGPTYVGAHKEMEYIHNWSMKLNLKKSFVGGGEGAQRLELNNGAIVETRSAQHKERLASDAPHKIYVVEAGQVGPGVREQLQGRALENDAQIIYSGTLEDSENTPRFAWYEKTAAHWKKHRPGDHCEECDIDGGKKLAFSLPSWSNLAVFPDGEDDAKIQRLKRDLDPFTFDRMVRGIPSGVQHPAYPQLAHGESRLRVVPEGTNFVKAAGGADYGAVHPSALVVVSLTDERIVNLSELSGNETNVAWVRECWWDGEGVKTDLIGDTARLKAQKFRMSRTYKAYQWSVDPNERFMAGDLLAEAVRMGAGTRDNRIGQVKSRLNNWTLYFDMDGPGVAGLYEEMKRVHYKVGNNGELALVRLEDDRTAALENAIDNLDGKYKRDYSTIPESSPIDWGEVTRA